MLKKHIYSLVLVEKMLLMSLIKVALVCCCCFSMPADPCSVFLPSLCGFCAAFVFWLADFVCLDV